MAGIILGYKKLSDAAIEFGDNEAIAELYVRLHQSMRLRIQYLPQVSEFNKMLDIVKFFATG